jgi:ABC-type lipoprotein release transport system permease subunit
MKLLFQIVGNLILYGYLLWSLYNSTIVEWDPWDAFVVVFVLFVALVTTLTPALHAAKTSPGTYPYDD